MNVSNYQSTSTAPSVQGQLLSADATGKGWQITNLVPGSNVTISTSTAGQITIGTTGLQPTLTLPLSVANGGTGISTAPVNNGQLLMASSTGWTVGNLVAGPTSPSALLQRAKLPFRQQVEVAHPVAHLAKSSTTTRVRLAALLTSLTILLYQA